MLYCIPFLNIQISGLLNTCVHVCVNAHMHYVCICEGLRWSEEGVDPTELQLQEL